MALSTSRDPAIAEPGLDATQTLREAGRFDDLLAAHALAWAHLWEACDVAIEEKQPAATALKLRVYIFHLLQTVSPHTIEFDIGCPPAAGTVKRTAGISSGTSCLSFRF